MSDNLYLDGLMGLAVGDALGVPYEFMSRAEIARRPFTGMTGGGMHAQPPGTWSDDTSMALATADSLAVCGGVDLHDMMERFCSWREDKQYTATGRVFDVGLTCHEALRRFRSLPAGTPVTACGNATERGNGNGSLMRILPISLYQCLTVPYTPDDLGALLGPVHDVSSLTHGHPRTLICCGIWTVIVSEWLHRAPGDTLSGVITRGFDRTIAWYMRQGGAWQQEAGNRALFHAPMDMLDRPEDEIMSGGYVMESLYAAFWALLSTDNYADCMQHAIRLGHDTDTTACIAGGLAGLVYGLEGIPAQWREALRSRSLLEDIACRLNAVTAR